MRAERDHKGFKIIDEATGNEFCFRHPSARRYKTITGEYSKQFEEAAPAGAATDNDKYFSAMATLIRAQMTGWKVATDDPEIAAEFSLTVGEGSRVELPFHPDKIDLVMTYPAFKTMFNMYLAELNPELSPNSESPALSA